MGAEPGAVLHHWEVAGLLKPTREVIPTLVAVPSIFHGPVLDNFCVLPEVNSKLIKKL